MRQLTRFVTAAALVTGARSDIAFGSDLDVRGFQIAVDDAFLVGSLKCCGDLEGEFEGFLDGDRTSFQPFG
jgi:hypothetical protein